MKYEASLSMPSISKLEIYMQIHTRRSIVFCTSFNGSQQAPAMSCLCHLLPRRRKCGPKRHCCSWLCECADDANGLLIERAIRSTASLEAASKSGTSVICLRMHRC